MKAINFFIKADYIIQAILLILIIITIPTVFLPLFGLILIGTWQLFSALFMGLAKGCVRRLLYFATASAYCGFLWVGDKLINAFHPPDLIETGFYLVGLILIPISAAFIYFSFTKSSYHEIRKEEKQEPSFMV